MSSALSFKYSRSQCSPSNRFYILNALPEAEASASTNTRNAVLDGVLAQDGRDYDEARSHVKQIVCPSQAAFDAAIALIGKDARAGKRPMIFIHGHGEEDAGLQLASGTSIPWPAYLEALGSITRASRGELTVIAAFCYSMSPIKMLLNTGRLPFAFYYGYDSTITAGEVHDETSRLYSGFLRDGGRAGPDKPTSLKLYSEYDHISRLMLEFASLYSSLGHDEKAHRTLSIRKAIRGVEEIWPGATLGGTRNFITDAIHAKELVATVLDKLMYDTERRRRLIDEIYGWLEQAKQGAPRSVTPAMK